MKKILKNLPLAGKYLIAFLGCFAILSSFLVLPMVAGAALPTTNMTTNMSQAAGGLGSTNATDGALYLLIGKLVDILLGILGVILVVLIIWAGFMWMTSNGDAEKVKKAKSIIIQAVIGLVIIFAAYALATFVITALSNAVNGQ